MADKAFMLFTWCLENKLYEDSLICLHRLKHLHPDLSKDVEEKVLFVLKLCYKEQDDQEFGQPPFKLFEKALQLFPESAYIYYELGCRLYRTGNLLSAISQFQKAFELNSSHFPTQLCLENTRSQAVDQWHFRMLNDVQRNVKFYNAISDELSNGRCEFVLDIGTGTGIFSMMAAKICNNVYACEMSNTMFSICKAVLDSNLMKNRIIVFNNSSLNLEIPKNIPEKVHLVITEIFDAGLLGEGILGTLKHAWENLLLPPLSSLTPEKSYGKVIPNSATIFVSLVQCEWLRKSHRLVGTHFGCLDFSNVSIEIDKGEPYNSEYLSKIPGGYKLLSQPIKLCTVNFNDPREIDRLLLGCTFEQEIPCTVAGIVDCVAMWFELNLNEGNIVSTAPESNSCWEQAIFPIVEHLEVIEKDVAEIAMAVQEPIKLQHLSILGKPDSCKKQSLTLNGEWIRKLNCPRIAKNLQASLQQSFQNGKSRILDLESVPLATLLSIKMGNNTNHVVCNKAKQEDLLKLCKFLEIQEDKISFLDIDELTGSSETYDLLFFEPLKSSGIFQSNVFEDILFLKQTCLTEDCDIYPNKIALFGEALQYPIFTNYRKVSSDKNVLNFKISDVINAFQTSYQEDLLFDESLETYLIKPVRLLELKARDMFSCREVRILVDIIGQGVFDSFIYWVVMEYGGGHLFDTRQCSDVYNLAAYSLLQDMDVNIGDKLEITSSINCSFPRFTFKRNEL